MNLKGRNPDIGQSIKLTALKSAACGCRRKANTAPIRVGIAKAASNCGSLASRKLWRSEEERIMGALAETLYATETADSGSGMLKLVRLSFDFRKTLITNPTANLSIVGYLSLKNIKNRDPDDEKLTALCDRIKAVRDRLAHAGVWEKSITAYLPLRGAPITEDLIVLTAYDKLTPSLFPGVKPVPLGDDSIDPTMTKRLRPKSSSIRLLIRFLRRTNKSSSDTRWSPNLFRGRRDRSTPTILSRRCISFQSPSRGPITPKPPEDRNSLPFRAV